MGKIVPHPALLRSEVDAMAEIKKIVDNHYQSLSLSQLIGLFEIAKLYVLEIAYEEENGED